MLREIALSLCSLLLLVLQSPAGPPAGPPIPEKEGPPPEARPDCYDDPLPKDALVRIGTTRLRQPDTFVSVAFAADGRTLASVSRFGRVSLWDAATGRLTHQVDLENARAGLPRRVRGSLKAERVAFSCDGTRLAILAAGLGSGRIWIRDPNPQNSVLLCPPDGHVPRAMAFSPDNRKLAELSGDIVSLWDIGKREVERQFHDPGHTPWLLAFSRDGKQLASGGTGIRIWDADTGKLLGSLEGHEKEVYGLAFTPDGKTLVSAGRDNALRYWDVAQRRQVRSVLADSTLVFACSPDRKVLATSRAADKIQLWDAQEGKLLREINNEGSVDCLAFSPDGKKIVAAGRCRALRLWDVQTGKEALPLDAPLEEVVAVAFSPDGRMLATSAGHSARLWDSVTGRALQPLEGGDALIPRWAVGDYYPGAVVGFTPDGKHLAALDMAPGGGAVTWRIHIWDALSREKRATLHDPRFRSSHFAFAPDNDTVAVSCLGGTSLWSLSTQKQTRFLASNDWLRMGGGDQRLRSDGSVAFSPDGRTLACTGLKGIRLRDWQKGTLLRFISGEWPSPGFVAFSPDGKLLATCQGDNGREPDTMVHFWEVATGTWAFTIDAEDGLNGVAFSPDGRLLATAPFKDKTVRLWSIHSGKQVAGFEGHHGPICSVAFSPDGKRLASGSTDTTALIWSLEGIGAPLPRTDPDAKTLDELWAALAAPKAAKAYPALWSLAGAGDKAARFLAARVSPATEIVDKRTAALLAALESNDFPTREAAAKELVRLGQAVVPALGKTLDDQPSAEMRKRLQSLLEEIGTGPPPAEALRQTRAVQVLEQIASPQACELLKKLATGAAEAELTRDARAALRRLERRPIEPAPARLSGACLGDDPKQAPKAPDLPPFHKLGLSDEQLKDLARVRAKYAAKVKEVEEKIRGLRDEEAAELENVLTDAQRARLKELRAAGSPPDKGNPDFQGDKLVKLLDADFEELLAKERDPAALREAARLFESSKKPSAWTDYSKALAILRRTRAKAGIPLLLRCMVDHASVTGHNEQVKIPRYAETFIILTGKEIDSPYKSVANPAKAAQDAVAEVVRTWWLPNKAKLTTELGRMSLEQRQAVARVLLREGERDLALSGPGGGTEQAARRISHILQLQLERSELPGPPRIWQPEDLHPTMLPFLLAEAGWEADPPDKQLRGDIYRIPFAAIPLLASLRKNGNLPDLHRIAADRRQTSATRLTCLLALAGAGEALETKPLLGILDGETKQERRLAAVLALEHCRDANAAVPQLVKLLEDPDRQVRYAAVLALRGPKPKEAVPALKKLLDELPSKDRNLSYVLRLLGDIGGKDAQAILADFLRKKLADRGRTAALGLALHAFEKATGKRWTESGSPTDAILRKQVKQALEWWDKQKEEREK